VADRATTAARRGRDFSPWCGHLGSFAEYVLRVSLSVIHNHD
jgi:hypothetical protein